MLPFQPFISLSFYFTLVLRGFPRYQNGFSGRLYDVNRPKVEDRFPLLSLLSQDMYRLSQLDFTHGIVVGDVFPFPRGFHILRTETEFASYSLQIICTSYFIYPQSCDICPFTNRRYTFGKSKI